MTLKTVQRLTVLKGGMNAMSYSRSTAAKVGWLRGSVVERRSSAGVLSMSCARPVADG